MGLEFCIPEVSRREEAPCCNVHPSLRWPGVWLLPCVFASIRSYVERAKVMITHVLNVLLGTWPALLTPSNR